MGLDQNWLARRHLSGTPLIPGDDPEPEPGYLKAAEALGCEPLSHRGYNYAVVEVSAGYHRKNWTLHWIIKRRAEERGEELPNGELAEARFSRAELADLHDELFDLANSTGRTSRWPAPADEFGAEWRDDVDDALDQIYGIIRQEWPEDTSFRYRASW